MKNKLLLFTLVILLQDSARIFSQTEYRYQFYNDLHGSGGAPDLTSLCSPVYQPVTFTSYGGTVHVVYNFNAGCGLVFNDAANFLAGGAYSLEFFMELDNTSYYRKLVDYKNLSTDDGLYVNDGACNFRGPGNVSGTYFTDSIYSLVTITRSASTFDVKMFVNGLYVDKFNDAGGIYALYDANKKIQFFKDDTYSSDTEISSGSIAMLNIYNYELDSMTAIAHYATIGGQLGINSIQGHNSELWLSPNPVNDLLHINNTADNAYSYSISDVAGRCLYQGRLARGENVIDVAVLPAGLYLVKTYDGSGNVGVYKVVKQ